MKTLVKDFTNTVIYISAVLYWINQQWQPTKDLLVDNNFLAFSDEGICIPLFTDASGYIRISLVVVLFVLVWMVYRYFKSLFSGSSPDLYYYVPWTLFFMWFGFLLTFVHLLTEPVPWYGLVFALTAIFLLIWLFVRKLAPALFHFIKES